MHVINIPVMQKYSITVMYSVALFVLESVVQSTIMCCNSCKWSSAKLFDHVSKPSDKTRENTQVIISQVVMQSCTETNKKPAGISAFLKSIFFLMLSRNLHSLKSQGEPGAVRDTYPRPDSFQICCTLSCCLNR